MNYTTILTIMRVKYQIKNVFGLQTSPFISIRVHGIQAINRNICIYIYMYVKLWLFKRSNIFITTSRKW